MYLGSFDLSSALTNTLHATHFGVVCDREPVRFTGYYKYVPGPKFQDKNGNILNAGVLLADETPIRCSRVFCTRWNG